MIRWFLNRRRLARARHVIDEQRRELIAESSALLIAIPTLPDSMMVGVDLRVRELRSRYLALEAADDELRAGRVPDLPSARAVRT